MSNQDDRDTNKPFRLQFGGASETKGGEPVVVQPQQTDDEDDVNDEFVFHSSATIAREHRAARPKPVPAPTEATTPPDQTAAKQPVAPLTEPVMLLKPVPIPEPVQAAPPPTLAAQTPPAARPETPPPSAPAPAQEPPQDAPPPRPDQRPPRKTAPEPVTMPATPVLRPRADNIGEFGYVLPEDNQGKQRSMAPFIGLAAGLMLALGAAGGAWLQSRDTGISGTSSATPPTAAQPATTTAGTDTGKPADPPARATATARRPAPDTAPEPEQRLAASGTRPALPGLDLDAPPQLSDLRGAHKPDMAAPQLASSSHDTIATPDQETARPRAQDVAMLAPSATPGTQQEATPQPAAGPAQTQRMARPAAPSNPVGPGPLPARATARPSLVAPDLGVTGQAGPRVTTLPLAILRGPVDPGHRTAPDLLSLTETSLPSAIRPARPAAALALGLGDDLRAPDRSTPPSPPQTDQTIMATPPGLHATAQDTPPTALASTATPDAGLHLTTPVLLAASARLIRRADAPGGQYGAQTSYSAADLAAPDALGRAPTLQMGTTLPDEVPMPRRWSPAPLAAGAAPPDGSVSRAPVATTGPVQIAALQSASPHAEPHGFAYRQPAGFAPDRAAPQLGPHGPDAGTARGTVHPWPGPPTDSFMVAPAPAQSVFPTIATLAPSPRVARPAPAAAATPDHARLAVQHAPMTARAQIQLAEPDLTAQDGNAPQPTPFADRRFDRSGHIRTDLFGAAPAVPALPARPTRHTAAPLQVATARPGPLALGRRDIDTTVAVSFAAATRVARPDLPQRALVPTVPAALLPTPPQLPPQRITITGQPAVPLQTAAAILPRAPRDTAPDQRAASPLAKAAPQPGVPRPGALVFLAPKPTTRTPADADAQRPETPTSTLIAASHWSAHLPFALADTDAGVTLRPIPGTRAPRWLGDGVTLMAVNGTPVTSADQARNTLDQLARAATGSAHLTLSGGTETLNLTRARQITLPDGLALSASKRNGKWKTAVTAVATATEAGLRPGDTLLFDFETRKKLTGPMSFETLMANMETRKLSEVTFAIVRAGALENATLTLTRAR